MAQRMSGTVIGFVSALLAMATLLSTPARSVAQESDTSRRDVDTLGADSLRVNTGGRTGIDTIVAYNARRIVNDIRRKRLLLYGEAEIINGDQRLTGNYIEVDFNASTLYARAYYDSATGRYSEVPVFKDGPNEVTANEIRYNFKTKRATLAAAESRFQDGFYYAERTYRVSETTTYIQDGRYTTCDAPHPHFYFSAPEMKIVEQDKVFADQVTLNVADVPVFFIPFGVFFASRSGKQSGIILPDLPPSLDAQKGVVFRGLGFFWAGNDYLDALATADIYSKGGFTLRSTLRGRVNAIQLERTQIDLTYTESRTDPDLPFQSSWIVNYMHTQRIGRRTTIGGAVNYTTRDAIRNSTSIGNRFDGGTDITLQLVTSNISLSTGTSWGLSLSTGYGRTQNIVTDELTQSIPVSLSLPSWTPFADATGEPSPLSNLSLGYSGRGGVEFVRRDTIPGGLGFYTIDTRSGFTHQPFINWSVRLGNYFTFVPGFSYTESWFRRRTIKEVVVDTIISRFENGFERAGFYAVNLSASTKLYGIVQPSLFGISAIRHTLEPSIDLAYAPDYGDPRYGYYDQVTDPVTGAQIRYSIFEGDAGIGSVPTLGKREEVGLSLRNSFEAKVIQGDTLPDRKITLLNVNASIRYNMAAPFGFRWHEARLDASTDLGPVGKLTAYASFDPYDTDSSGRRIPQLRIDAGKGIARLTSFSLSLYTQLSDRGFTTAPLPPIITDTAGVRRSRFDFSQIPFDEAEFFGETVRGARGFSVPWSIDLSASYFVTPNYNLVTPNTQTERFSLQSSINFSLTPTVRVQASGSYSLVDKKIAIPSISVIKDLHCWELSFNWIPPSSFNGGYSFRLGIKAPQLQDVQIKRQE